jgi:hypothetical protein
MAKFTDQQQKIIARKLGYEGPMQGFQAFLNSSPALQSKFNTITSKYAERMAKGGMVKGYAQGGMVSDDLMRGFFMAHKDNPALIKQTASQYGISPEKAAQVLGVTVEQYNAYVSKAS